MTDAGEARNVGILQGHKLGQEVQSQDLSLVTDLLASSGSLLTLGEARSL